jgi:hypothetical protein
VTGSAPRDGPGGRARLALALGAAAGVALAGAALLRGGPAEPARLDSSDAVAWVNGQPVARESFARFVAGMARERGGLELDPAARRELLERMIDEELLLQQGIALGLERREPAARRAIVSAVVDLVTSEDGPAEPTQAELEALYAEIRAAAPPPAGASEPPSLETVLPELRGEWTRRQHEARLREHLAELRAKADVRIAPEEP